MFAALFASFWAKLAGFALAGAVVTGGLGVSGNIPGPGQELFNNAAQQVGIPVDDDVIEDKAKTDEVTPGQDEDIDAEKVQDGEKPSINHGHCVSYAAKVAGENLDPGDKGRFVRIVAGNKDAVSGKVAEGEAPDAACAAAISAAMAQVQPDAASKGSEDNRKPKGRPGGEADGLKGGTEVETDAGKEKKRSETVKQDRPHNEKKSKSAPGSGPPASPGGKPQ